MIAEINCKLRWLMHALKCDDIFADTFSERPIYYCCCCFCCYWMIRPTKCELRKLYWWRVNLYFIIHLYIVILFLCVVVWAEGVPPLENCLLWFLDVCISVIMLSENRRVLFITWEIEIYFLRVVCMFDPRLDFLLCECLIMFLVRALLENMNSTSTS